MIRKTVEYRLVDIKCDEEYFSPNAPAKSITFCVDKIGSNIKRYPSYAHDSVQYEQEIIVYRNEVSADSLNSRLIRVITSDSLYLMSYTNRLIGKKVSFWCQDESNTKPLLTFRGFSDIDELADDIKFDCIDAQFRDVWHSIINKDQSLHQLIEINNTEIFTMIENLRKKTFKQKIKNIYNKIRNVR